jgi:hypothetical protein
MPVESAAILSQDLIWVSAFDRRCMRILGSSGASLCSGAHTALAHIILPQTGVCCSRYVAREDRVRGRDRYLPPPRDLGQLPNLLPAVRQERLAE